jgi:hypothetical protein
MAGITETKEMVGFILALGNALAESMEDDKLDLADVLKFLPALKTASVAMEGSGKIMAELKDLDEAEVAELNQYVAANFDIADDEREAAIENGVAAAMLLAQVILSFGKKGEDAEAAPTE